jgi:hypothetical protein
LQDLPDNATVQPVGTKGQRDGMGEGGRMSYRADRYWWAYVLGAFVILGLTTAIYYDNIASMFARGASGENWTLILSAVMIAAFSLAFIGLGLSARKRWRLRRQAIEGDPLAVPESKVFPDVNEVFDISREPLTLPWRVGSPFRRAFASVFLGASTSVVLLGIFAPLAERVWSPLADSPLAVILDIASQQPLLVIVFWIPIYCPVVWLLRNRLVIIEATGDGIRFQPLVGRIFVMRWQDVRLFEVEEPERKRGHSGAVIHSYALYDRRRMISWNEWGTRLDLLQPEGITWDEMWALSRELVDVIYQRTGLTPRTFYQSLQRGPVDAPEQSGWEAEEA